MAFSYKLFTQGILICLISVSGYSQTLTDGNFSVKGKVVDSNTLSLQDVFIYLMNANDSSLVKTEITDAGGNFVLADIKKGNYLLKVEMPGDSVMYIPSFNVDTDFVMETIRYKFKERKMEEVTVVKKKTYLERSPGKLTLNVESSINSAGSSAFELLEKAPGIRIQNGDNINLNGKAGVIVLIDGKRIPMTGSELANYLRGIPSGSIEKIELISNPSAKYDAAGSAVIDIKLKKDTRIGTNGSFTSSLGHGVYPKLNEGVSLNHRNKKVNLYGSYNYAYRKAFNKLLLERRFYNNGIYQSAYIQNNYLVFPFKNQIARAGVDYTINSKNTVSLVVNGLSNKFNPQGINTTDVLDANEAKISSFKTLNNSKDNWYNMSGNLNLKHKIDTLGSEITGDLDYAFYGNKTEQNFDTRYYNLNEVQFKDPYILFGDLRGDLSIYSLKSDYSKPLKGNDLFEAGVKSSYVVADNNLKFYDRSAGADVFDTKKSNHFIYQENINAAYVNWQKELKKWNLKLGLRAENTNIVGRQLVNASTFDTSYLQLFPNVSTTYKLNDKNSFDINFYRRIDRPGYDQLNPFKFYLDPTTYKAGNPYLRPQTTNTIEVAHLWKQKNYTSLSVSRTMNNITEVIAPSATEQNVTVQTMVNLKYVDVYSLNVSIPWDVTKWWNSTNNINSYLAQYSGDVANTLISKRGSYNYNINTVNTFKLGKSISAELTGSYQSKEIYAFDVINPIIGVSGGFQSKILKNKGVLKLNVTDIFFTQKISANVTFTDYKEHFLVSRETRVATLSFTYKFGNSSMPVNRRRSGGAEDLQQRVKNGLG